MKISILSTILMTSVLVSCGGSSGGGGALNSFAPEAPEEETREELVENAAYKAYLRPLNTHTYGMITSGIADLDIRDGKAKFNIIMDDAASAIHIQMLHSGDECPTVASDFNGDSFVDENEAVTVSGPREMPLDKEIESAERVSNVYPTGKAYTYSDTAPINKLKENYPFTGRVVMIYGASNSFKFPGSVSTFDGKTPNSTLPIACGVLERI